MSSQSTPLPNYRVFSQELPPKCKLEQPPWRARGNICGNDNTVTSRTLSCKYTHTHTGKDLSARLHTAARFVTAGDWEQPRCPSVGNGFNELWSIYTQRLLKKWRNHLYADLEPSLRHTVKWKEQGVREVVNGKVKEYINTLSHKCIKMSGRTHKAMIALVQ